MSLHERTSQTGASQTAVTCINHGQVIALQAAPLSQGCVPQLQGVRSVWHLLVSANSFYVVLPAAAAEI